MLSKTQHEDRFMIELEDMWNDSAKFQYLDWDAFVSDMYRKFKEGEE